MAVRTTSVPTLMDVVFDRAAVGLCLVAPDGTVVRANAEWLRSAGLAPDQAVGEDVAALLPEPRDVTRAALARARAGHRVEVPRHARTVNGRETWWEGSVDPVSMDGGELREAQLADAALAAIPVVVVTAGTTRRPIDARQVLRKPFAIEDLFRAVDAG